MMATDIKTKDDLRRELRLLEKISSKIFPKIPFEEDTVDALVIESTLERIEDIKKALED